MGMGKEMLFLGGYLSIPEVVAELAREQAALARADAVARAATGTIASRPEAGEPLTDFAAKVGP